MHDYLFFAISCLCILPTGLCADKCEKSILARRNTLSVPEGDSLSLSCVVLHCGDTWEGNWTWSKSTGGKTNNTENSDRRYSTNVILSINKTSMVLNFVRVSQSDEGYYGCKVKWSEGVTEQGHMTYLNITAAVPSQRNLIHRILVCGSACVCLPVILVLARCLSSGVKSQSCNRSQAVYAAIRRDQPPQPPPRRPIPKKRSTSSHKAPPKSQQNTEVVYADISKVALSQPGATKEPAQSTVYSSVRFS
ncbi:uncharacterized protein si:dkey-52l18.4 isoform X2 [Toxotes jaculatrix]|uniref:uncharacterized protein si:dkey-52l18.4 isoform X1 n=1 Tax=Toxotes jaculatrix TaxID=941984 RepID=UPI001B3B071B|nr:uncharacterized protein si:dkey-52l18.4 isoform X1 [Toxotes jaculatrix]XP_040901719.1 uncharacterized protein si:dkey-52l18.4 isoform X2 [Toxotes jaculatrix]